VRPKQEDNSVLFHPALPGILDRVEMMVKGGDRPVTLQPWFIDSGYTGIWLRPYNLFWAEPITVDWQGWRKVTVPAPPVPAYHGVVARSGKLDVTVPAGAKSKVTLVEVLPPGIYDLSVQQGPKSLNAPVLVLDARKYFGDDPGEVLINPLLLRRQLGLTTERT